MRPAAAVLAVLAALATLPGLPPAARAEPRDFTAGVSLGRAWHEQSYSDEANPTLGLWARVGVGRLLSVQLELQQITSPYGGDKIRSGSALLVLDLVGSGRLVPMLFAGGGLDRATYFGGDIEGHHFEGGVGLEYRSSGGLFIGADLRLGGRSLDNGDIILTGGGAEPLDDAACCGDPGRGGSIALFAPAIAEGEYRAMRVTAGVRF